MTMNPIPPQAYTKDTLLKAYSWLQNQDDSIKEMATTPDILVSIYLKATRDGDSVLDRPSIQNFKQELKQLAGMMGDFENQQKVIEKEKTKIQQHKNNNFSNIQNLTQVTSTVNPTVGANFSHSNLGSSSAYVYPEPRTQDSNTSGILTANHIGQSNANQFSQLDEKSLSMIKEACRQLNLSSEQEALKVLIQVGYNKMKKLF